jgi:hypothetical protein
MVVDKAFFMLFRNAASARSFVACLALVPASVAFAACSTVTPAEPSCEGYRDEEPPAGAAVTWRFVNATNRTIYLAPAQGCSSVEAGYQLTGPEGTPVRTESDVCGGSCEMLQDYGNVACAADCAVPPIRALPAGTAWEHVWDATEWASTEMSEACVDNGGLDGEPSDTRPATSGPEHVMCVQRVAAAAGAYEFALDAFSACVDNDELCTCTTTDADGTCRVSDGFSAQVQGQKLSAKTTFSMPATGVVEVRFEGELCEPSSSTTPCAAYASNGCCEGEACVDDGTGQKRCTPPPAP